MEMFVRVAETGSFSGAARDQVLGVWQFFPMDAPDCRTALRSRWNRVADCVDAGLSPSPEVNSQHRGTRRYALF
jgi:hypothetical protein